MNHNFNAETEDQASIFGGKFKIVQKKRGYRYNIDSLILADFFRCPGFESAVDLGCGCGIIAFLLSGLYSRKVHGIELQKTLAQTAQKNVDLNGVSELVTISNADIKNIKEIFKEGNFDAAVSNPPFYPLSSGRINPDQEKALARHEVGLTAEELLKNTLYLLKEDGVFALIYPTERYEEIVNICDKQGFSIETIRFIKTTQQNPPKTFMMRLRRSKKTHTQKTKTLPPLVIHENNKYSQEILDIFTLFGAKNKGIISP